MQVNMNAPIGAPTKATESTPSRTDEQRTPDSSTAQSASMVEPDYEINLSETGRKAATDAAQSGSVPPGDDLSETEAIRLSDQVSRQLATTNTPIANQAIQNTMDLFA